MIFRPLNKVHYDQKVTGETHLDNDIQLERQSVIVDFAFFSVVRVIFIEDDTESIL